MSKDSTSYFEHLPVEVLFRIFEDLDLSSLFFSLGQTCHRLRTVVNLYDRLSVDFTNISKTEFQRLLHRINPHNIISLTLTNRPETLDAVKIFRSHYQQQTFDRLHSLTLNLTLEDPVLEILKCVRSPFLTCITLKVHGSYPFRTYADVEAVASMIVNANSVPLNMAMAESNAMLSQRPTTNMVRQLTIGRGLSIDEVAIILDYLPHLEIFSVHSILRNPTNHQMKIEGSTERFRQLKSLTIESLFIWKEDLEYILSLTSSLTHLKLVGGADYRDGKRWEQFIQVNLPHLEKFEFFFVIILENSLSSFEIESMISSFQSRFWLEEKKWFVRHSQLHESWANPRLSLYSLPICIDKYTCHTQSNANPLACVSLDDPFWMDNISTLVWHVEIPGKSAAKEKPIHSNRVIFRHVKILSLNLGMERQTGWLEQLSSFVDFRTISKVKIDGLRQYCPGESNFNDIAQCLLIMPNLQSLEICFYSGNSSPFSASTYCSLVPLSVRHLAISALAFTDCITILERFDQLYSLQCYVRRYARSPEQEHFQSWLDNNRIGSSFGERNGACCVWLRNQKTLETNKRRKY